MITDAELLTLPTSEKARIADLLLASIDGEESETLGSAWAAECKDRKAAYLRGEIEALDGESVIRGIEKRYNR